MIPHGTFSGVYDDRLIALSVFIAIVAAYAALDLASRITNATGKARLVWIDCGGIAMGVGIWAMHYVGMAALTFPVPVLYDWPTVVDSALAAIVASILALSIVSRPTMGRAATIVGSIFMGAGIAAMHYIGMAAMRMPAMCHHSPSLVTLSILLAIAISYAALKVQFDLRAQIPSWSKRKFISAILLGAAIPVMHYVGMAAVILSPGEAMDVDLQHAVHLSTLGLARIVVLTLFFLTMVIVGSIIDRRISTHIRELAESRLQLQTIFDNMNDGIVVLDLQRNVVHANHTAIMLLGPMHRNLTSAEGAEIYQVLLPNGQFLPRDQWPSAKAIRGEFIEDVEFIIRRKDGNKEVVAAITTTPIMNTAGELIQVMVTYRDISVLKLNTDTRARLAAIVESSEDAFIGKDDTGIVRSWNAAAERIFGYPADEMIGQSIMRLLPAGHEQEEYDFLNRLKRGEVIDHVETVRKTKSGKLIHVSLTISPIRDAGGKVVGASKMARDITSRKQMERQLQQSQKMQAIGQLTGGIAHDFNNLLGVIVGNLGLLERLIDGNEGAMKRLQTAQKGAARGADLTRRLLAFSSSEELKPTSTSLAESIHNTIELAARTLGPEIKIVAQLSADVPSVFVDPAGLESALLNLVVNARDAMPRGGTLTISSEAVELEEDHSSVMTGEMKSGRYASVTVTDTGVGMSRETLERALEPFFTTKPRGKGTGLGLAMVYGFVKQSGGTVLLYSEVGYGTTVTFYLQLARETPQAPKVVVEGRSPSSARRKVLVVDDEADLLEIAFTYLTEMGYTPFQAVDGDSALEIVRHEQDIDLVVTDVIMPGGMNGVELVQKIREFSPHIKVIYSSGFPADALAERSGTVVDGALLHKPYQRAEFDAIVRCTLEATDSGKEQGTQ
jgi:PAS domain S-box-containing protein